VRPWPQLHNVDVQSDAAVAAAKAALEMGEWEQHAARQREIAAHEARRVSLQQSAAQLEAAKPIPLDPVEAIARRIHCFRSSPASEAHDDRRTWNISRQSLCCDFRRSSRPQARTYMCGQPRGLNDDETSCSCGCRPLPRRTWRRDTSNDFPRARSLLIAAAPP
jgi:hypothetical protein